MKIDKNSQLWNKIKEMYKTKKNQKLDSGWILIELFYDDLKYSLKKRNNFNHKTRKDFKKYSKWFYKKLGADYSYGIDSVIHEKWVTPQFLYGFLRQLQYMHKMNQTFRDNMLWEQHNLNIYPVTKSFINKSIKKVNKQDLANHLIDMLCCEELNYDITNIDSDIIDYVKQEWLTKLYGWDYQNIIQKYFIDNLDLTKLISNISKAKKAHQNFKSITKQKI